MPLRAPVAIAGDGTVPAATGIDDPATARLLTGARHLTPATSRPPRGPATPRTGPEPAVAARSLGP